MTFLNPLLLLGLLAAAIPLVIHLFNFRRPRRIEFSSLAFLREIQRSTMRRVRIKQWLLLLLRTLAIAALVLAFARPALKAGLPWAFEGSTPATVALVVDDTPSMTQRDARGAYIDQALEAARAIAATTDPRDEVFVISVGASAAPGAQAIPGGEAVLERLDAITAGGASGSLVSAVRAAVRAVETGSQPAREIYVISDVQKTALQDSLRDIVPTTAAIRLVPVGTREEPNVAVTGVRILSRIIEADQPVRMEAELVNHGTVDAAGYAVSVYLEGERIAQASADLPPGIPVSVPLVFTPRARGWLSGRVQTEDDAFASDNRSFFTLFVPGERSLLLVEGTGRTASFVATAFSQRMTGNRVRFSLRRIQESALPAADLAGTDVIILAGPVDLSDGEVDRLARFTHAGGGLFLFPGEGAVLNDYNALLASVGGGQVTHIVGGPADAPIDLVDGFDLDHPLFDGMFDSGGATPERPSLYRRMSYRPGSGSESAVMTLAGGTPFLQEIRHGRGSVLVSAAAADPAWTDLPTRGLFVPLLFRAAFLLSSSGTIDGERFRIGEGGELLLPAAETELVTLQNPAGERVAPPRRQTTGGGLIALRGLLSEAGVYDVLAGDRLIRRIAVNPDPAESNLARMGVDEAASLLSDLMGVPVAPLLLDPGDREAARTAVEAERRGLELWNVFLGLALLFLVLEMAVARHWRPESVA